MNSKAAIGCLLPQLEVSPSGECLKPNSIALAGSKLVTDRFEAVIHVPWTHPIQHSKLHVDRFSHFYHSRESLYFNIMCVKMQLTRN